MSNGVYVPVNNTFHKSSKLYAIIDGKTKAIKKGYCVVGGVNMLVYTAGIKIAYTGNNTVSRITVNGKQYVMLTITSSGTLTINGGKAQYWMCGAGEGGKTAHKVVVDNYTREYYSGYGGGGGKCVSGTLSEGVYAVTIGSGGNASQAGGTTQIGDISAQGGNGSNGGSGGGGYCYWSSNTSNVIGKNGGTGDRIEKYPFGVSDLKAHCGAGGGGSLNGNYKNGGGGAGGSNGSNGSAATVSGSTSMPGGKGGAYGGGTGGNQSNAGSAATYYGSGGGGGGCTGAAYIGATEYLKAGGSGYQGVVYVIVPTDEYIGG